MSSKETNKQDLTQEQVFAVADTFYKENDKAPRQQDIKDVMGGSMSTINPMLKKWKEVHANELNAVSEAPEYVRDGAIRMASVLWRDLESDMKQQIDAIQKHTQEKMDEAEKQEAENLEEIERLEREEKKAKESKQVMQEGINKANEGVKKAEVTLARVEAERDMLTKQLEEQKAINKDMYDRLMQFGLKTKPATKSSGKVASKISA